LLTIRSSCLDELIEEGPFVVVGISITGDKAAHITLVFEGDLDELALFHERVHAGIVRNGNGWGLSWRLCTSQRGAAANQEDHKDERQPHRTRVQHSELDRAVLPMKLALVLFTTFLCRPR